MDVGYTHPLRTALDARHKIALEVNAVVLRTGSPEIDIH